MKIKFLSALAFVVASCQPVMAGERIGGKDNFELPGGEGRLNWGCVSVEAAEYQVDNLENFPAPDCLLTFGLPISNGNTKILHLYRADSGKDFVILEVTLFDGTLYSVAPLHVMVELGEQT